MTLLLNPDGEKFEVKTCTEALDRAHYVKDAATQSIKNQIDLGRKKIKPEGMRTQPPPPLLPSPQSSRWPQSLLDRCTPLTRTGDSLLLPLLQLSLSGEAPQKGQLRGPHHPRYRCNQNRALRGSHRSQQKKVKGRGSKDVEE